MEPRHLTVEVQASVGESVRTLCGIRIPRRSISRTLGNPECPDCFGVVSNVTAVRFHRHSPDELHEEIAADMASRWDD